MKQISLDHIRFDRALLLNLGRMFSHEAGTCLLYSGGSFATAQSSFLCLFPYEVICIESHKQWKTGFEANRRQELQMDNPWEALKSLLTLQTDPHPYPEWVGFLSYEMGAFSDQDQRLKHHRSPSLPYAYLQRSAVIIAVDHATEKGTVLIADPARYFLTEEQLHWVHRFQRKDHWVEWAKYLSVLEDPAALTASTAQVRPFESLEAFKSKVLKAKELIHAGEIYQVNLSQLFSVAEKLDPYQAFYALALLNPAPFATFLKMNDITVVSSSPERFLKKQGDMIETRPIKGTAPRGNTEEEDRKNKDKLLNSSKDQAELLMIIDLMRNDLARVSVAGSVETPCLWECETYANVFHLVSTIRSKALPGLQPIDILRTCFPGGSITGCPKLSAMEVIATLENRNRGIYTGSLGYFAGNGDFDFNIAIRTLVFTEAEVNIQLGGGIVADSDPQKEYEETLHKGASIFKALGVRGL